jgi:hypothetical protein
MTWEIEIHAFINAVRVAEPLSCAILPPREGAGTISDDIFRLTDDTRRIR